MEAPAATT
jgi:hypothetical protein